MADETRCKTQVYSGDGYHGHCCPYRAVKDGFCKRHHPDTIKARRATRDAKWEAAWTAEAAVEKKRKRLAAAERRVIEAAEKWRDAETPKQRITARIAVWDAVEDLLEARK